MEYLPNQPLDGLEVALHTHKEQVIVIRPAGKGESLSFDPVEASDPALRMHLMLLFLDRPHCCK